MDRREFTAALLALTATSASAQTTSHTTSQTKPELKTLTSGVFEPGPSHEGAPGRASRPVLIGMLAAGNVRLEIHETIQQPGAEHEPIGTHLHNEIWCVRAGTASLYINGTEHRMVAGDIGLVCAGDKHWIKNIGNDELSYFVLTVGPRE